MKTLRCLQHSRISIYKSSRKQSHDHIPRLSIINDDNPQWNIFHISHRKKVANPRYSRSKQQVDKMDFRYKNTGQFDESGHEDINYSNLDYTLPESEFLKDIDDELIKNTYIEYNNHWMKNFIKFSDAEFESFNTTKQLKDDKNDKNDNNDNNDKRDTEYIGYARIPETETDEISESLQYLEEWKKNLKQKQLEDDYQVKLPNGLIISYSEYLATLNKNEKDIENKQSSVHTSQQLKGIQRHLEWHKREAIHDEYGRSHGEGRRKNARATAMVYEGDGNIFINDKHYGEYFLNYVDRMNIMIPFLVTGMERKLNAWCQVNGGGDSGQSGAIREAIARAIANYQPTLQPALFAYKLTIRDWRKRERKKSGKPKARKSVRWKAR